MSDAGAPVAPPTPPAPSAAEVVVLGALPDASDWPSVASVEALPTTAGCVVIAPQAGLLDLVAAVRRRLPLAHIVGVVGAVERAGLSAVAEAGFDEVALDLSMLRQSIQRIAARRREEARRAHVQRSYNALAELVRDFSQNPDLSAVLLASLRHMSQLFAIEQVSVVLYRPGDEYGFVVAEQDRELSNVVILIADYPELQEIMRTRAPLVISDIRSHALLAGVRQKIHQANVRHCASVLFPLLRRGEVVGALFLRSTEPVPLVDDDSLSLGRAIAAITAIAVGSAIEHDILRSERLALLRDREDTAQVLADLRSFAFFFEQSHDGIVVTDRAGVVRYVNRAACRILGHTTETLQNRPFVDLLSEQYRRLVRRAIDGEPVVDAHGYVDLLVITPDETEVVISAAIRPLAQQEEVLVSFRDVTDLREIESELRQTKEFLENMIQSSVDAIIAADTNGTVILFNRAAEQMLGYSAREAVGRLTFGDLFAAGEADDVMRRLRSEAYGGRGRLALLRRDLVSKSGTLVPVHLSAAIIYEEAEEIAAVGIFTDLRERMKIEEKLDQVQRQLQVSERQAVAIELAGVAAHELNQPMTSILGYAELLRRKLGDDAAVAKPLEVIGKEIERMAGIVRKLGQITDYKSKAYVGRSTILDLGGQENQGDHDTKPLSGTKDESHT